MLLNNELIAKKFASTDTLPSLFIGHGSPMLALETPETSPFVKHLSQIGELLTTHFEIEAICIVSAHWLTKGTYVNVNAEQQIIYDFGGFPQELYQVEYPVRGHAEVAMEVSSLSESISPTADWGLDHGSWTVLKHLFPKADIPAFQLSIDFKNMMDYHTNLAREIALLRNNNILVIGSGNIVHNLKMAMPKLMHHDKELYGWEEEFDDWFMEKAINHELKALEYYKLKENSGLLSVPTPDHYIPALYTLGTRFVEDELISTYEELLPGLSMRSFLLV